MLQSEVPYNQHLMLVLIKEIKDCPKEKIGLFLAQAKSENAQAVVKTRMKSKNKKSKYKNTILV
ncbi:MAG: hypothetical protein AB8B68_03435 [Rickettsiaceae bacterium]